MSENTAYRTPARSWSTPWRERLGVRLDARVVPWSLFIGVTLLALALNTWNLTESGYGNTYYAATVRSMTLSWKNFFFGAFDQYGFITVDKPPFFLWVGALSARIFGYSSLSMLLPGALAGTAAVSLLWLIVRRWFGLIAATIAALVLALSPISVATTRLNLPEPFLILALVGAAGCIMQSIESRRWWAWIAAAGLLVGVAFNTKMLAAWIPGPAFALAVLVTARGMGNEAMKRVIPRIALLGVATLIVSGSWIAVVDAWPASDRPYIAGSTNNTALNLAFSYNGINRVNGDGQAPGFNTPGAPGQFRGAGGVVAGSPGFLRLFDNADGGQIGWLLPFALAGGYLAVRHWRKDPTRRAGVVLFLGWILTYGLVYSFAQGIYHGYYTATMVPGVAATAGIAAAAVIQDVQRNRRWLLAWAGLIALTVYVQLVIAGREPDYYGWVRPLTVAAAVAGAGLTACLAWRRLPIAAGLALSFGALLLLPGAWALGEASNVSLNATLPQAGPRTGYSSTTFGSKAFDAGEDELAAWLNAHNSPPTKWQLVVNSSQSGSYLIAAHNITVMSLGGFSGHNRAIDADQLADYVAAGEVRYVETETPAGAIGKNPVLLMAAQTCPYVNDPTVPKGFVLYDCADKADALHATAAQPILD
ncbi:MAG TPA: glycosyltransferase family 39 protein [Dehalococcoidia bacterium]|nr:glycosyltransferase family 39 protein [Dehalococcoidia bacterium]